MKPKVNYTYDELVAVIEKSGRKFKMDLLKKAYDLAYEAHGDQRRKSGELYITHPVSVAVILVELGMDSESLIAALLHDVVEDTHVPLSQIESDFGAEVALLVNGVTKLGQIPYSDREKEQAENIRKMLLAMAQDIRVMIIKLADRLHNARTFEFLSDEKARYKSKETMEIYAPIAHRLGMKTVKEELEDISLRYLDPIAYNEIESQLALRKGERTSFIDSIKERIKERVDAVIPDAMIEGRVKSTYGIYRKVYLQGRSIDEIFDVYAVRVIVDNVGECYNVLGIVHDMFQPIPNRFKDYISTPKQNMYQSLHTTVFDKHGIPFEIQIRTWDMHYTAEYGIAAHWKYKSGIASKDKLEERIAWVRQLIENQQDGEDAEEIIRSIKSDIAPDEVFVFTPKGDVVNLPTGATVIDFAYAIHSGVGNRMSGAKVDGKIVPFDFEVQTGMIVEIITKSTEQPNRDWLSIVKTSEARSKIRNWFKREKRPENIEEGKNQVEKEFKRNSIHLEGEALEKFLLEETKRQKINSVADFYAAIGYGGLSLAKILPRLKETYLKNTKSKQAETATVTINDVVNTSKPEKSKKASSGVIVEGLDSCLVKFAKCCNPVPGDNIVGFITRGAGVSIHKTDCINYTSSIRDEEQKERWVKTSWANTVKESFHSSLDILCATRGGLFADISVALNNLRVPVNAIMGKDQKDNTTIIQLTITVSDINQLTYVINSLKNISGVLAISRAVG